MQFRIVLDVEFDDHTSLVEEVERATREALVVTRREKDFANPALITSDPFTHENSGTHIQSRLVHKYTRPGRTLSFLRTRKEG